MKTLARFLVGMAGLVLAICSDGAVAATECNGPVSGTIVGGVVVNAGDVCFLGGATVAGSVRVNGGGTAIICGSTINGGIIADGARAVIMGAEEIGCAGDVVDGAIQVSNTGPSAPEGPPSLAIERSIIAGAVRLTGNSGAIAVAGNSIAGGLFCASNTFALEDEGMENVVTGPVHCDFGS